MAGPDNVGGRRRRRRSETQAPTLTDVAQRANVSAQTVSRTLRKPLEVSEETRSRVEAAIAETGYVPNLTARGLASNSSNLVATIVPSISTSVFADTLDAASAVLSASGYELVLGVNDYDQRREETLIRNLLGRRPDGVLLIGVLHTPASVAVLRESGLPVVETWDWTDSPVDALVGYSNADAMSELTESMVQRGYRRPVFVGSLHGGDHRSRRRLEGFESAHRRLLSGEPRCVDASDAPLTLASGGLLLASARARFPDADLVMFGTDILAAGAVLSAHREGIAVPEDVAISGFGDFELASELSPALTTVAVPVSQMGDLAARHLLERMTGRSTESEQIDIGYRVVARDTT